MYSIEASRKEGDYWSLQVQSVDEAREALRRAGEVAPSGSDAEWKQAVANYGKVTDALANEWEQRDERIRDLLHLGHLLLRKMEDTRRAKSTPEYTAAKREHEEALTAVVRDWQRVRADFGTKLVLALSGPLEKWRDAVILSILACVTSFLLVVLQRGYRRQLEIRQAAELHARQSEARYRRALDQVVAGVFETTIDGQVIAANPAYWSTVGYSETEVRELGSVALLYEDPEKREELLKVLRDNGSFHNTEVRLRRKDGLIVTVLASARLRTENGIGVAVEGSLLDISDRKLAEQKVIEHSRQLEEAHQRLELQARQIIEQSLEVAEARDQALMTARMRSEFLTHVTDEINRPLQGISDLNLRLLSTALGPDQLDTAGRERESIEALRNVLSGIEEYTRIETDRVQLRQEPFSLRAVVEDVMDQVAEAAEERGLALPAIVRPGTADLFTGDPQRLRQILLSLVENAVASTRSGQVGLRVSGSPSHGELSHIRFDVEDTGAGIEPSDLSRVFEPFARKGAGLEMAIARQLVERMGGAIGVESEPGQGTRFWLGLPMRPRGSSREPRAEVMPSAEGRRVLIVDPVSSTRGITGELAAAWGMRVTFAESGDSAVRLIASAAGAGDPFELAILEQNLPGTTGMELAQTLLESPRTAAIAIVIVLPFSERQWTGEPLLTGAVRFVARPLRESALRAAVGDCFASRPPNPSQSAPRALVVDDNAVNLKIARRLMEKLGWKVDCAGSGAEALDCVLRARYGLILMDWQMPLMDGLQATAAIRALDGEASKTPIVAMTANAMEGDREACLSAGMNDYLSKPLIFDKVKEIAARWSLQDSLSRPAGYSRENEHDKEAPLPVLV